MTKIYIQNDSWTENLGGYDPDDEWTRDSTSTDHNVKGIEIVTSKNGYGHLEAHYDVAEKGYGYLLYVVYSTGDTFGRDDGQIEYIGLYDDETLAYDQKRIIEEDAKLSDNDIGVDSWNVEITHPNGKKFKLHKPWEGYFEQLQYVSVDRVEVL